MPTKGTATKLISQSAKAKPRAMKVEVICADIGHCDNMHYQRRRVYDLVEVLCADKGH